MAIEFRKKQPTPEFKTVAKPVASNRDLAGLKNWIETRTRYIQRNTKLLRAEAELALQPAIAKKIEHLGKRDFAIVNRSPEAFADWQIADLRLALEKLHEACRRRNFYLETDGFAPGDNIEFRISVDSTRSYRFAANPMVKVPGKLAAMTLNGTI